MSPPHISAYSLTIEKNTVFQNWLNNNVIKKEKEEQIIRQFNLLKEMLEKEKYIQYETSSFSKKGYESKHNSGYWKRKKYLKSRLIHLIASLDTGIFQIIRNISLL